VTTRSAARDCDIGSKIAHIWVASMRNAQDSLQLGTKFGFQEEHSFRVEKTVVENNYDMKQDRTLYKKLKAGGKLH
jgi:hypothetical protein